MVRLMGSKTDRSDELVWLRCAVEQIWVLWLHDLWWLEGGAVQVKGASNRQKKSVAPHEQDGCTNLNWYGAVHQRIMIFMYILTGNL